MYAAIERFAELVNVKYDVDEIVDYRSRANDSYLTFSLDDSDPEIGEKVKRFEFWREDGKHTIVIWKENNDDESLSVIIPQGYTGMSNYQAATWAAGTSMPLDRNTPRYITSD